MAKATFYIGQRFSDSMLTNLLTRGLEIEVRKRLEYLAHTTYPTSCQLRKTKREIRSLQNRVKLLRAGRWSRSAVTVLSKVCTDLNSAILALRTNPADVAMYLGWALARIYDLRHRV